MKTTVILARHGKTQWNKDKKLQGISDIPLAPEGKKEAKLLAKRLKEFPVSKIYASALTRTIQTAQIIAEEVQVEIEHIEGLNERNYGELEGASWEEINKKLAHQKKAFFHLTPKRGESFRQFQNRITKHFQEVTKRHPGETIVIVSHGGVLNAIIRRINNIGHNDLTHYTFPNTSITIVEIEDKKTSIQMIGDTKHLT